MAVPPPRLCRSAFWKQLVSPAPCAAASARCKRFAKRLRPYLPGILAHCRWPLGTNLIEGINNKIKVIKRMAYGFRDDAYATGRYNGAPMRRATSR